MLAIANGKPELLSLKDIISHHTKFHYEVLTRKYETLLKKEGFLNALHLHFCEALIRYGFPNRRNRSKPERIKEYL